jgi:predicted amidohydrolase
MLVGRDARLNLERILRFIEKSAEKGSDIVCMPEACLVNDYQNVVPVEKYLRRVRSKCRELSVWCLLGTYAKKHGMVRNLALLIGRDGAVVHTYAKVNLYRDELEHGVVAGIGNGVIKTQLGSLGVIICFDFAYPEYVKMLSLQGAEIVFCPSFMVDHEGWAELFRAMPVTRAFENSSYFVLTDAVTSDARTAAITTIASPRGTLASIEGREGIALADLDMREIRTLKERFGVLRGTEGG